MIIADTSSIHVSNCLYTENDSECFEMLKFSYFRHFLIERAALVIHVCLERA